MQLSDVIYGRPTNFSPTVMLIGGHHDYEGFIYATNPSTGIFGPVCDDNSNWKNVNHFRSEAATNFISFVSQYTKTSMLPQNSKFS